MHALECAADGSTMDDLGDGVLACNGCGHRTDQPGAGMLADGFDVRHRQWGLRGDPHVWAALREATATVPTPADPASVGQAYADAFERIAKVDLSSGMQGAVLRGEFAHGGMSSGMVDVGWWRTKGLPLLVERAVARRPRNPHPAPEAEPPQDQQPDQSLLMGLLVWAVLLGMIAGLVGGGGWLLYQRYAGEPVQATVLSCETSGSWAKYGSTIREECVASWTIDGQEFVGGFAGGHGAPDVGKTLDATVRGDTAYSRSLWLPLVLLGFGLPLLAMVLWGQWTRIRDRRRGDPQPTES